MNRKNTVLCAFMLLFFMVAVQFLSVCENFGVKIALAETPEKCVYLTFDDGPSDRVTPKILDVLKEENVKATFFIVGKMAERRKYLVEREFAEGHTVAVHSYSHVYKEIYSSAENLLSDIDRCNALIKEITGKYSGVYRFPGGSFCIKKDLIDAVTAHGMRYVDWNASMRDAEIVNPTPADLLKAAIDTPANREHIVMLAHDTTDKTVTAQALKSVIQHYKKKGYVFAAF
ncbi:MAG: polysaccharide deacetylase [Clostridia bacterium]|nr:polysaccharide deacetylase [Clostridia bacterium]